MNTSIQTTTQTAFTEQKNWGERIAAAWQKQVPAILETGALLVAAQDELGRGNWVRMAKNQQLPFGLSTANKLMKIFYSDHFKDSELIPNLPANWAVLHELSLLDAHQFEGGINDRKIHPKMTLKDAKTLRGVGPREPDVKKESAISILKKQVEDQTHKIAHLEDQLATADAGSLFDLKEDTVQDIVSIVVNEVRLGKITRHKAIQIADAIKAALKT